MSTHLIVGKRCGRAARVLLFATVGLGLVTGLGAGCHSNSPSDEGRGIAESFLTNIREGKVDSAWSGTTAEFKSFMGLEQLRKYVKGHPVVKEPAEFSGAQAVSPNGLSATEYVFHAPVGASASTIKVLLAREQGALKVERLTVE
jgi:hypothetical protein